MMKWTDCEDLRRIARVTIARVRLTGIGFVANGGMAEHDIKYL